MAEILEEIGLEQVGAPGTTAALAMLNDQVKKGGVMASSYVGGLSGAFIPVSEDKGMIDAVQAGTLTMEKLEAMTCVCSVGLDMIAIPGKTQRSYHLRYHRRRDGDRHGKSEDNSRASDPGDRKRCGGDSAVWRTSWLRTHYPCERGGLQRVYKQAGKDSRAYTQL